MDVNLPSQIRSLVQEMGSITVSLTKKLNFLTFIRKINFQKFLTLKKGKYLEQSYFANFWKIIIYPPNLQEYHINRY
jgi:hypothetical protein